MGSASEGEVTRVTVRRDEARATDAQAAAAGGKVKDVPGPQGVGTAVAFDWAIAAELIVVAAMIVAAPALGIGMGMSSFAGPFAHQGLAIRLAAASATLIAGAPVFALGEALRSGWRLARPLQVIFSAALTVYGVVQIPDAVQGVQSGHYSGLPRSAYLLIVSPLIAWGLTRPRTKRWFETTTSTAARARHGSVSWLLTIAAIAVIGGLSIALSAWY